MAVSMAPAAACTAVPMFPAAPFSVRRPGAACTDPPAAWDTPLAAPPRQRASVLQPHADQHIAEAVRVGCDGLHAYSPFLRGCRSRIPAGKPIIDNAAHSWLDTSILMSAPPDVRGNKSSRFHLNLSAFRPVRLNPFVRGNISIVFRKPA